MNSDETPQTLLFTDLDGTLLDHHTYSLEAAREMLEYIETHPVVMIIVTSKTEAEVKKLLRVLEITAPAVVENGAGILMPEREGEKSGTYRTLSLAKSYTEIRQVFERLKAYASVRGFGDMTPQEVGTETGLAPEDAQDAMCRSYTEPFILESEEALPQLRSIAGEAGMEIVRGGRFWHLITQGQDKAAALRYLVGHYQQGAVSKPATVALGDGENDLTMLGAVETPILIPKPDGSFIPCDIPHLIKAPYPGPKGWNTVLKEYFHVT